MTMIIALALYAIAVLAAVGLVRGGYTSE